MPFPIAAAAIIGGSAVVGGIANYMASKEAQKLAKNQIARLEAIAGSIEQPNFDARMLSLEDYELAAKYIPELAAYIEEQRPEIVRAASPGAIAGRQAQMESLDRYRGLAQTGEDMQSRILNSQALKAAQIQNQGQQEAVKQNFAQRGMGGSTMEYVQALMAQQSAGQNANNAAQNAAMQAYNTRLDAVRNSANLGGQIRGEDVAMESKNADIINNYNQRMAAAKNQHGRYIADTRNSAQQQNIAAQQAIMNANTSQKNQYKQDYQTMLNNIQNQKYNAQLGKANVQIGVGAQNLQNIQQNAQGNRDLINSLVSGATKGASTYAAYGSKDEEED